jgi:DNA-binding MarR family transcriptional regulator
MSNRDVQRLLAAYPRIFFACHRRHVHDRKTGRALSAHQASILDHLDTVEPMSLHDLASHMGVTPSTMSLAIDRLERGGYVVRERAASDRRRLQLRLTDAGERIKDASSVLEPELVAALLRQLSAPDRRDALRGLDLLADAADATVRALGRGIRAASSSPASSPSPSPPTRTAS